MAANSSSTRVIYAALIGNLLVALTKAGAAAWTGSSAMLSEAIHSFVDIGNQILLLYGLRRAALQADPEHPIGYGRELYFWSFIVALLVFALGAVVAIYHGVLHVLAPEPIHDAIVNYVVLGLAFLFEGASWWMALRHFKTIKGKLGYYAAFRDSKDPPSFVGLFEDSAALIGILIAAAGTFAADRLGLPALDGGASILIGVVLAGTAALLARESKSLLIGERADRPLSEALLRIAEAASPNSKANGVLTVQLAPDQILAALSLEFADTLRVPEVEAAVAEIERRIRAAHPEVVTLFVKPQTGAAYKETLRRRFGEPVAGVDAPLA
ncbi:cation diffusion facilitator family transporter [Janthinobacterium sp.]|uniref:cation diffusion facilitator family transporter n=1 Tax=Janthinobacterium sp. TaxID=1871054 RepID=UPI00293D3484|nr:cation diffusion facilitator family transporter [Janthinobacterium sp.]